MPISSQARILIITDPFKNEYQYMNCATELFNAALCALSVSYRQLNASRSVTELTFIANGIISDMFESGGL